MAEVGFRSEDKSQEGCERRTRPDFERPAKESGKKKPKQSSQEKVQSLLSRLNLDRTQAAIILCGFYLFFSLAGNIAATKVTYFGSFVMDAGFIYSLTFTWRDLIHKQLGKRAAITTIWLSAIINLIAALYFQLVVLMPAQPDWAGQGGQVAWAFLFGIQLRVVIGSIITALIAELIDTYVYQWWVSGIGKHRADWTRVFVSNAASIPVDSMLFPVIAFAGIVGTDAMMQMFGTNIAVKAITTILAFWTIYLVPERPIYREDPD
jgi:queuosine precursor transporter